jgi:hypothetical protein
MTPGASLVKDRPDIVEVDGLVLYLRSEVVIRAQIDDESVETKIVPHHVSWHDGGHKRAQEVEIEIHGSALPFPLEHTASIFISLFQAAAKDPYESILSSENLAWCGYADDDEPDDEHRVVRLKGRDLSALLRDHAPLIPKRFDDGRLVDPTPRYSDTIRQAIERILSVVPGCEDGRTLTLREMPGLNYQLGALVDGRAKTGAMYLPPKCSAWDAIEIVCSLAARMVHVELNEIVVRDPDEAFKTRGEIAYTFIFGADNANAFGPRRHKKFTRNRRGVKLIAWNSESRKRVEAVYPDDATLKKNFPKKRPQPKLHKPTKSHAKKKVPSTPLKDPDRDVFDIGAGVWSQSELDEMARRVWLEKSMNEVDGSVSTPFWTPELLKLRNGARIGLRIRPDIEAQVRALDDDEARADYLVEAYGLERAAARKMANLAMSPHEDIYLVQKVTREWPSKRALTVNFCNLYKV